MSRNQLTVQCTPTIVESYVGFEDATREEADICCAQRAVHLRLKSLSNNMLVLSHKDKALTTWCPSPVATMALSLDILCGSSGPP